MPKSMPFAVILNVKIDVELVSKDVAWWMKPRIALCLFLFRLACWLSNAEIDVKDLPPMKERIAEINIDKFMRP